MYRSILLLLVLITISVLISLSYFTESKHSIRLDNSCNLPKIIWKYWEERDMSILVNDKTPNKIVKINENLIKQSESSGWEVRMLTPKTVLDYVDMEHLPKNFYNLGIQHKADYYRMYLLEKYGGLWMDASIIVNDFSKIEELYKRSIDVKSQLTVFKKMYEWEQDKKYPIIENWFIMAPKKSPIITLWFNEYKKAIEIGFKKYRESLENDNVDLQGIYSTYHTQHLCIQKVLQKDLDINPPIIVEPADKSMLLLEASCKLNSECIDEKINDKLFLKSIPYIKLNGGLRDKINLHDYFESFSIL